VLLLLWRSTPVALLTVPPFINNQRLPFRFCPLKRERVELTDAVDAPRKSIERQNKIDRGPLQKFFIEAEIRATSPAMAYVSHRKCPKEGERREKVAIY